ncbi:RNA polymerase sigma factor [Actinokineospora sp. HUAS TT18]|uniref:RNA polymerase sigma factor n=1 Tax=Actinokineospora sp. HUAS TT18 TaxID=3447451 RepID=UPI003F5276A3
MADDLSVAALVEGARAGDKCAWDAIVDRYAVVVYATCRRYHLSEADTDDVGANVWLRLIERLDSLRDPNALPGWLRTTTANEVKQFLRRKDRQVPVESLPEESDDSADEWALVQERHVVLRAAFAGLSDQCKQLLSMLFDNPDRPYAEIAADLGIKIGSIGPTRQRCLGRLRDNPAVAALMDGDE